MKLLINFPQFDGFYNSVFDDIFEISEDLDSYGDVTAEEYELINWSKVRNDIGQDYVNNFTSYYKKELLSFGIDQINFVKIDSPKHYNYSTDKLVCNVVFNSRVFKVTVLDFISNNMEQFAQFVKDHYSSYSGFISFYSNNPQIWLNKYIKKINSDNVIFEGFLLFIMEHSIEYDKDYIADLTLDNKHSCLHFND